MLGSRHLSKRISKVPKSAVICWILAVCGSADVLYIPLMPSAHLQSKHSWVITVRFARTAITQRPVWTTESVWAELSKWRLGNGDDLWGNGDIVLSLVFISGLIIWSYTVCGRLVYYIHPLHTRTPTEWTPHIREALTAALLSLSLKPEASLSKPMASLSKYFLWAWVSESVVPGECWLVPEV